jgi:hypothetical protein
MPQCTPSTTIKKKERKKRKRKSLAPAKRKKEEEIFHIRISCHGVMVLPVQAHG